MVKYQYAYDLYHVGIVYDSDVCHVIYTDIFILYSVWNLGPLYLSAALPYIAQTMQKGTAVVLLLEILIRKAHFTILSPLSLPVRVLPTSFRRNGCTSCDIHASNTTRSTVPRKQEISDTAQYSLHARAGNYFISKAEIP